VLLALLAVVLAILGLPAPGTTDVPIFLRWAAAAAVSVRGSYAAFYQFGYPPLHFVLLRGAPLLATALRTDLFTGFKVSLLLGLLLTGGLFWLWTRNSYLSLALFLALLPSSMLYGYTDIYFAPLLVGAVWALNKGRLTLFSVLYGLACLVKLQPLILAPFLAVYLLSSQPAAPSRGLNAARRLGLRVVLPGALLCAATLVIFGKLALEALAVGLSNPFLSGQALNLNWIATFGIRVLEPGWFGGLSEGVIVPIDAPGSGLLLWPKLGFGLLYGLAWLAFVRSPKSFDDLIRFGLAGYLTYFMLNAGVHENHLFLAVLLAAILAWRQPQYRFDFGLWALLANLNLFVFYGADGTGLGFSRVVGVDLTLPLAMVYVVQFAIEYSSVVVAELRARTPAAAAAIGQTRTPDTYSSGR
jgi:hypothetical protein